MKDSSKQEYRTALTLSENVRAAVNAPTMELIKEHVRQLLPQETKPTFKENANDDRLTEIFHPSILGGKEPCGWIYRQTLPVGFDTPSLIANRESHVAA
jgi:hypothetical protein